MEMLEECTDLPACESILSEAIKEIHLLGEIPLSDNDIDILTDLIHQKLTPNFSRGTGYLKEKTPICFACFLVVMGRFYDKDAGYWPIVEQKIGPIDLNWKVNWGKFFDKFLYDYNLPKFNEEKGLVYVAPILGHACIPDCCLDEYFDRVLSPLINRDLLKPLDRQEIIHDLKSRRKINENRIALDKKKNEYDNLIKKLQREQKILKNSIERYEKVASLLEKEDECIKRKIALNGLENATINRSNIVNRINELNNDIRKLTSKGKESWEEITNLHHQYQTIINFKPQIDDIVRQHVMFNQNLTVANENEKQLFNSVLNEWAKLSVEPWNNHFGEIISELPFEQLIDQITQYRDFQEKQISIQKKIEILEGSVKEEKKPPKLFIYFLTVISKAMIWFNRKNTVHQSSEIQLLQATNNETEAQLKLQREIIKGLFTQLPVDEKLLNHPTPDLHKIPYSLKLIYERYIEFREKRIKIEEEGKHLTEQVRDLASSLGITIDKNLDSSLKILCKKLKEAEHNQENTLKAKKNLEKEFRPLLEAASLERQGLQATLEKLDKQLAELGSGSTQNGLDLVHEFNQSIETVKQTRKDLNSQFDDILSIENELHNQGLDLIRQRLEEATSEVENRIIKAKNELKQVERGFESYPVQYIGIDEPIRRFLLYGGVTAENYLTDCVTLFVRVKSGECIEDISDLHLPNRVLDHFQNWWEDNRTKIEMKSELEEDTNLATGEIFRAPRISFDITTCEVKAMLPSQRLLRSECGTTIQLEIFSADSSIPIFTSTLKLYSRSGGMVDTQPCNDIVLKIPSEKYIFYLKHKDNILHKWEMQGLSDKTPYFAFSANSHKLIKTKYLPRTSLIIVINKMMQIHPQECILTVGGCLFGGWKEFTWYEVDLLSIEEFSLLSNGGQKIIIPLSESDSGIVLLGGNQLAGIFSNERPVFNSPPESIRLPLKDEDNLHLLRLSLFCETENQIGNSKHYQLNELTDHIINKENGWIEIPMNLEQLLGTNPMGCFTLRVYRSPYLDWQRSFCIIPKLSVSFDKELYLPYHEKIPDIISTITLPEMCSFKPDSPAKIISRSDQLLTLQTPASENEITGIVLYTPIDRQSLNIPLTFSIPKIRWRLQGLDDSQYDHWCDKVLEELWIGDWLEAQELFLIIETPWFYAGKISLVLLENSISIEIGKPNNKIIRVDLKALEDNLRAGPPLETVSISLIDAITNIPNIPLFSVRTCWLAEKIKCFHYPIGDSVRLDVSWKEKGKANQKAVRLWYLSDNQPKLIQEQVVSQNEQETHFSSTSTIIKSGKYLIHLEPFDQWSSRPLCPKLNDQNTAIIEIITKTPEKSVYIRSVGVDEHHTYPLPQGSYRIDIIGKVINQKLPDNLDIQDIDQVMIAPFNENWYVGNLEVKGIPEVIMHLSDTNPVKFEYDSQKHIVTSIEDRHGDGAVYCFQCNMLFWYQGTVLNEKTKKHRNYGPIEKFWVEWESN